MTFPQAARPGHAELLWPAVYPPCPGDLRLNLLMHQTSNAGMVSVPPGIVRVRVRVLSDFIDLFCAATFIPRVLLWGGTHWRVTPDWLAKKLMLGYALSQTPT